MKSQISLNRRSAAKHLDKLLDDALEQTFPASDPVAIDFEQFDSSSLDAAVDSTRTDQRKPQSLKTSLAAGLNSFPMHGTKPQCAKDKAMRNGKLSRRSVLKGSTVFAAHSLCPKLLKAAAPDPTAVGPALIEAAMKEDTVAFYTAMEIPVAEALGKAFEAKYPGIVVQVKRSGAERVFQRIGKEEAIRLHEVDVVCSSDASHFIFWKRDGLLAPYVPEDVARHFPSEQIDPDGITPGISPPA